MTLPFMRFIHLKFLREDSRGKKPCNSKNRSAMLTNQPATHPLTPSLISSEFWSTVCPLSKITSVTICLCYLFSCFQLTTTNIQDSITDWICVSIIGKPIIQGFVGQIGRPFKFRSERISVSHSYQTLWLRRKISRHCAKNKLCTLKVEWQCIKYIR